MYNKTGIRRFALAMIIQALKDLTLNGEKKIDRLYRDSANIFLESEFSKIFAQAAGINNMNYLYAKYKNKPLIIKRKYKNRKRYHIRNKKIIISRRLE